MGDMTRLLWEQRIWPRQALRAGADVMHAPYFALPLTRRLPAVVTIHDLIPMVLPEYRDSPQVKAYTWLQALACRSADAILVDSEWSKRDVLRLLRVPADRVRVVYLGVDEHFTPNRSGPRPLDKPYIFYIGGWDHRKNVATLIAAFRRIMTERPDLVLAIAGEGGPNPRFFPDLRAAAAMLGDRVVFLGRISDDAKVAFYQHAELFVFPSLYEGFGLDPLEAMACGCPVVCSDATSLPEIVGDAGLLVDARDPAKLAQAMREALADPWPLREKGPRQASKFRWDWTAVQTRAVYRDIATRALADPVDAGA
jgi:glycosyltransferase involved in cell wall biosynthesis